VRFSPLQKTQEIQTGVVINMDEEVIEFLKESNAIESVFDNTSLYQAQRAWAYLERQKSLTPGVILRLHKILMLRSKLAPNEKGYFRLEMVYVNREPMLDPEEIPQAINDWVITHGRSGGEDGIKNAHIAFEKIHPFIDGNGRIGRIIMNWQRVHAYLPIVIIHQGEDQLEYYKWFQKHD